MASSTFLCVCMSSPSTIITFSAFASFFYASKYFSANRNEAASFPLAACKL